MLELDAPAKVNLGLRILGVRPDGYHLLESLFVPLDLCDAVGVELEEGGAGSEVRLTLGAEHRGSPAVPSGGENLAVRAAAAYLDHLGRSARVRIRLTKSIPVAAGLGGGSSDAAAVLRALAELLPWPGSQGELAALALRLGADVPYFLAPRPAVVSGIGEVIEPVERWPELWLALANPGISLATADVYAAADALSGALTTARAGSTMRAISDLLSHPNALEHGLGGLLRNDLEPAALRLCPPVGRLREQLVRVGAMAVGMSGSGATVFGVFEDREDAEEAVAKLDPGVAAWARAVRAGGA